MGGCAPGTHAMLSAIFDHVCWIGKQFKGGRRRRHIRQRTRVQRAREYLRQGGIFSCHPNGCPMRQREQKTSHFLSDRKPYQKPFRQVGKAGGSLKGWVAGEHDHAHVKKWEDQHPGNLWRGGVILLLRLRFTQEYSSRKGLPADKPGFGENRVEPQRHFSAALNRRKGCRLGCGGKRWKAWGDRLPCRDLRVPAGQFFCI